MSLLKPLPHQIPILKQLQLDREKGKSLVVIPSGAGKTYLAAFDSLQAKAKSILYIAHRREILNQAAKVFKAIHKAPDYKIGFVDADNKQYDRDIVFASNTILGRKKATELTRTYDYVVIDEYHHVAATTYQRIIKSLLCKFMLGLTATPFRLDKQDIMGYVNNNISGYIDLEHGIKEKILVPFQYNGLADNIDYSDIKWLGTTYRQSDLDKKLLIDRRDNQIVNEYLNFIGKGHSTIAFCVSVKHCHRMVEKFTSRGISCNFVTYETPMWERAKHVADFENRKFDVLFVRDVFSEGIDFPHVEGILFLRPTWSKTVFLQQLGRGLRKADKKTHVTVLDFIGNYHNAFRTRDWLGFAEKAEESMQHRPHKPEFEYDVPRVYFDRQLIDLFDYQRKRAIRTPDITFEELRDVFLELEGRLGRVPRYYELKQTAFGAAPFKMMFGNYSAFLLKMGRTGARARYDINIIREHYLKLKSELGRIPVPAEWARSSNRAHSVSGIRGHFGSWHRFIVAMEDKPVESIKKQCRQCGNDFDIVYFRGRAKRIYCSAKCGNRHQRDLRMKRGGPITVDRGITRQCKTCEIKFVTREKQTGHGADYCSNSCYRKQYGRNHPYYEEHKKIIIHCGLCKKSFERHCSHQIYCSKRCRLRHMHGYDSLPKSK